MKKRYFVFGCFCFGILLLTQFSSNFTSSKLSFDEIPSDVVYDGCSMFPDGNYGDCCKKHDDVYFFGGTWQARLQADTELMHCVMKKGGWGYDVLGPLMWSGVRIGGAPIFPTSYRWGFGRDQY